MGNALVTSLLLEIGLCAILTLGLRHSRDLTFYLNLAFVPWTMTMTPAMYTGNNDNDDDDDTCNNNAKLAFVPTDGLQRSTFRPKLAFVPQ